MSGRHAQSQSGWESCWDCRRAVSWAEVKRPIIWQRRPIIWQKRPIIWQKRPIIWQKRPFNALSCGRRCAALVGLCVRLFCNIIGLFCHMCGVYVCRLTADVYVSIRKSYMCSSPHLFGICLCTSYMCRICLPCQSALHVCLICLPYMSALYVCLIAMPYMPVWETCSYMHASYVCLICMSYIYTLYVRAFAALYPRHEVLAAALGITLSFIVCFDGASSWDSQIACDQQVYYLYYRAGIMFGVWAPFGIREVRRWICIPYGQLKRSNRSYTFPKTFSFELRFWHNLVPDMHDSSEKWSFQGPPNPGVPHCKCKTAD